jgi:cell division protein FtsB
MMDIDKAFEQFIEFPEGSSGNLVTTVSAKLFAKYCTETLQEENERLQADVERLRKQVHELQNQREHMYDTMLQWRGIERENGDEPCRGCNGSGVRAYGNTTTWRGGVGGQVITSDVCDKCWGSGNSENVWVNLKSIARISRKEAELVDVCGQLRAEVERLRDQVNAKNSEISTLRRERYQIIKSLVDRLQELEDENGTLRRERDQLKAILQQFMSLNQHDRDLPLELFAIQRSVSAKAVSLASHDAEVIEQWIGQARYMEGLNVNDIIESAEDYANQLRQQAKED